MKWMSVCVCLSVYLSLNAMCEMTREFVTTRQHQTSVSIPSLSLPIHPSCVRVWWAHTDKARVCVYPQAGRQTDLSLSLFVCVCVCVCLHSLAHPLRVDLRHHPATIENQHRSCADALALPRADREHHKGRGRTHTRAGHDVRCQTTQAGFSFLSTHMIQPSRQTDRSMGWLCARVLACLSVCEPPVCGGCIDER